MKFHKDNEFVKPKRNESSLFMPSFFSSVIKQTICMKMFNQDQTPAGPLMTQNIAAEVNRGGL